MRLVRGSSWLERWAFAWTVANAVVMALRGEWSHASTYALAAGLAFAWTVNRQAADDATRSAEANIRGRQRANLALDLAVTTIEQTAMDTPEDEALRHKVLATISATRHGNAS